MKIIGILLFWGALFAMLTMYGPMFAILMGLWSLGLVLATKIKTW